MTTRQGFTLIELMIVVIIIGILAAIAIPNYVAVKEHAREANVKGCAHTVQLATEDFAVQHDGLYSDAQADLLPMFPGGALLMNVYTGMDSEPQFGAAAATAGQVGVQVVQVAGQNVGYTITCNGALGLLMTLSNGQ